MLGQASLFIPDTKLPLKRRVSLQKITVNDARYMLEQFHYLHRVRAGRQINYAVLIDGVVDGVITYAYPMISTPICGILADEMLEFARLYLHHNIPHSASCAIGKSLKHIKNDFKALYPDSKPIRMIISWSDAEIHKGTIYKACNFIWIKSTKGKIHGSTTNNKRGYRPSRVDYKHTKDCWIYRLEE